MNDYDNHSGILEKEAQTISNQIIFAQSARRHYSKIIVSVIVGVWFFFGLFCLICWAVTRDMPLPIFEYATGITAAAVGGYLARSAYQNGKTQEGANEMALKTWQQVSRGQNYPDNMERGENI